MVELVWNCFADRIVVYNGTQVNESLEIERLCGNVPGELPTVKAGRNAILQFVTDGSTNNGGFKAYVYFTSKYQLNILLSDIGSLRKK